MRLACASRTSRRSRLVLVATDTGGATARPGQAARRSRLSSRALTQTVSDSRRVSDLEFSTSRVSSGRLLLCLRFMAALNC